MYRRGSNSETLAVPNPNPPAQLPPAASAEQVIVGLTGSQIKDRKCQNMHYGRSLSVGLFIDV